MQKKLVLAKGKSYGYFLLQSLIVSMIWTPMALAQKPNSELQNSTEHSDILKVKVVAGGVDAIQALNNKAPLKGPAFNTVTSFLNTKDIKYTITPMTWTRAFNMVGREDNIIIYPLSRSKEREHKFQWIKKIGISKFQLIGSPDLPNTLPTTEQIIKENRLAICEANTIHCKLFSDLGFPEKNILKVKGVSIEKLLILIQRGRAHYLLQDFNLVIQPLMEKNPTLYGKFKRIGDVEIIKEDYLAAKNLDPEILSKLTTKTNPQ